MSDATPEQLKHWHETCQAYEECIKRRNKRINSLQAENMKLKKKVNNLMLIKALNITNT
jgi:hypothetical protein